MAAMKTKLLGVLALTAALLTGTVALAQTAGKTKLAAPPAAPAAPATDPRLDKIVEQNEKILKSQQEILQRLDKLETSVNQMRRRSS